MGDTIKPGKLGSATDTAAFPDDYADSMAADIETELVSLLKAQGLPAPPMDNSKDSRDRRMLFVAIARGVVKHLERNRAAIKTQIDSTKQVSPTIAVTGKDW